MSRLLALILSISLMAIFIFPIVSSEPSRRVRDVQKCGLQLYNDVMKHKSMHDTRRSQYCTGYQAPPVKWYMGNLYSECCTVGCSHDHFVEWFCSRMNNEY